METFLAELAWHLPELDAGLRWAARLLSETNYPLDPCHRNPVPLDWKTFCGSVTR